MRGGVGVGSNKFGLKATWAVQSRGMPFGKVPFNVANPAELLRAAVVVFGWVKRPRFRQGQARDLCDASPDLGSISFGTYLKSL